MGHRWRWGQAGGFPAEEPCSAVDGEGDQQRWLWGRPHPGPLPSACPHLCGAGCPQGLDQPLEPLQHGVGTQRGQPGQHDEGQHLDRETGVTAPCQGRPQAGPSLLRQVRHSALVGRFLQ